MTPLDAARSATAATLRKVASWGDAYDHGILVDLATQLEASTVGQLRDEMCCPVCEEVTCDEDCPLASVRADSATAIHVCDHPTPINTTALVDRAEVWHCGACGSRWSELGTRGHRWSAG